MSYIKAEDILPKEVLEQIQKYVDGQAIYIPRKAENRRTWGDNTAYKAELRMRNGMIRRAHQQGSSIVELAEQFHLSEKSIRRILRNIQNV